MIYAGMHNVCAVNFFTSIGVMTRTCGLVFFPSTVSEEDIELAFESESYSDFIRDNAVGFISGSNTVSVTDDYSQLLIPYAGNRFDSGVNFMKYSGEFCSKNLSNEMESFPNTLFYVPASMYFNNTVKSVQSGWTTKLLAADLNASTIATSGLASLVNLVNCNSVMDKDNSNIDYIAQGYYSGARNYTLHKAFALAFREPITADCVRLKVSLAGSNAVSASTNLQLWAKVDDLWVEVATLESISFSETTATFEPVIATEWCVTFYGNLGSSPNQTSYIYLNVFALGNSNDTRVPESFVVDKAVLLPYAPVSKYSDPTVEKAAPVPAVFLSVGVKGEVDVLSTTMVEGESISFLDTSIRIGGNV